MTRPLTFSGRGLFINAEVAPGGQVRVGVPSADKPPVAGYSLAESTPIQKSSLAQSVTWRTKEELPMPRDTHLRLALELKNARLYPFWIE